MKAFIFYTSFFLLSVGAATAQTRDNAGLTGNQGATSGFFDALNPVNYPAGASSWWHLLDVRHGNGNNNYAMQFSGSFFDQNLYFRKTNDNAAQPWSKVLLETDGKVGINTTNPTGSLEINGHSNGHQLIISRDLLIGEEGPGMMFKNVINNGIQEQIAGIEAKLLSGTVGQVAGTLNFFTVGNSAKVNAMTLSHEGNVGIGTQSPKEILELKSTHPVMTLHQPDMASFKTGIDNGVFKIAAMDNGYGGHNGSFSANAKQVLSMTTTGNVGIGTTTPAEKLSVNGKIRAHEIKVETSNWPDYVFDQDYQILGLTALENYIKANKHLPEMPSAKNIENEGMAVGDMLKLQQKKIEELTLYIIKMNKEMTEQKQQIEILNKTK